MKIQEVGTNACETFFDVEHGGRTFRIRLWAIVGGQMALGKETAPFIQQRYNTNPKYADDKWVKAQSRYVHQNPDRIIGPRLADLQYGEVTLAQFMDHIHAQTDVYEARVTAIQNVTGIRYFIKSKRLHDKENHTFAHCTLELSNWGMYRFGKICIHSKLYCGRIDSFNQTFIPADWVKADEEIAKIEKESKDVWTLYEMTEPHFQRYLDVVRLLWDSRSIQR